MEWWTVLLFGLVGWERVVLFRFEISGDGDGGDQDSG